MVKSKDKQAVQQVISESEQLKRTIEVMNNEHREQNEALRNNVQHMYKQQSELQSEIDSIKGEKDRLEDRIVEMKKRELEFNQFKDRVDVLLREVITDNDTVSETQDDVQEKDMSKESHHVMVTMISLYNQLFPNNVHFQNVGETHSSGTLEGSEASENTTNVTKNQENIDGAPANAAQVTPSIDQDLLNSISRLEQQVQEQQKKFDLEKDNLEQQLQVWKEKTRMKQEKVQDVEQERQELEKELSKMKDIESDLRRNVTQLEDKIVLCQQQIEKVKSENESVMSKLAEREQERRNLMQQVEELNLKQEKMSNLTSATQRQLTSANEMREQFRKEVVEANRKIKQLEPFVEKANRFDQLEKVHQTLVEQNQTLQRQHQELQAQEITTRNARDSLNEQLKKMESKSKVLQRDIDRLAQEKQEIIEKAKDYVHEMGERDTQQESTIKQLRSRISQFERGQQKSDETVVRYFVAQTLSQWSDRTVSQELSTATQELKEVRDKVAQLTEALENTSRERDDLQQQLKDKRTEYLLQIKKSKQVAHELRNQVTQLQTQLRTVEAGDKKDTPSLVRQRSFDHNGGDSPRHSLTRISSIASMPSTPVTNGAGDGRRLSISSDTSTGPSELEQQIMKENNLLVQRVADLQNAKWHFEERCRMLDENLMILKEELEKKLEIIQYYMSREKVGRIAPEQERFNQVHQPKGLAQNVSSSGGFMSGFFSSSKKGSKQVTPTVDAYNHMQQVMQETLLHNIQLQKDIKTLGDEIARLLNEKREKQVNDNV
jgi:chromosome segregation ATPase